MVDLSTATTWNDTPQSDSTGCKPKPLMTLYISVAHSGRNHVRRCAAEKDTTGILPSAAGALAGNCDDLVPRPANADTLNETGQPSTGVSCTQELGYTNSDLQIAATALNHDLTVVTRSTGLHLHQESGC